MTIILISILIWFIIAILWWIFRLQYVEVIWYDLVIVFPILILCVVIGGPIVWLSEKYYEWKLTRDLRKITEEYK